MKPPSTLSDLYTALAWATCTDHKGKEQLGITISHFMVGQMNWDREATTGSCCRIAVHSGDRHHTGTSASSPPCYLFDIYFAPVQWMGNYSQQPRSGYIWTCAFKEVGQEGVEHQRCHRGHSLSHLTCGPEQVTCANSPSVVPQMHHSHLAWML